MRKLVCRLRPNEVSRQTGISASYLSIIENNKVSPSFEILKCLAQFYGESLIYFTQHSTSGHSIVRKAEAHKLDMGHSGVNTYQLSTLGECTLYPVIHVVEPFGTSGDNHSHSGEEFLHVLSGMLTVVLNETNVYVLLPGDSMSFKASVPHRYMNKSSQKTRVLWVHTT